MTSDSYGYSGASNTSNNTSTQTKPAPVYISVEELQESGICISTTAPAPADQIKYPAAPNEISKLKYRESIGSYMIRLHDRHDGAARWVISHDLEDYVQHGFGLPLHPVVFTWEPPVPTMVHFILNSQQALTASTFTDDDSKPSSTALSTQVTHGDFASVRNGDWQEDILALNLDFQLKHTKLIAQCDVGDATVQQVLVHQGDNSAARACLADALADCLGSKKPTHFGQPDAPSYLPSYNHAVLSSGAQGLRQDGTDVNYPLQHSPAEPMQVSGGRAESTKTNPRTLTDAATSRSPQVPYTYPQGSSKSVKKSQSHLNNGASIGTTPAYHGLSHEDRQLSLARVNTTLQPPTASARTIAGLQPFRHRYNNIQDARSALYAATRRIDITAQHDNVQDLILNPRHCVHMIYEAIRGIPVQPTFFQREMMNDLTARVQSLGQAAESRFQQIACEIYTRILKLHSQGDNLRPGDVSKYSRPTYKRRENGLSAVSRLNVICDILRDCKKIILDIDGSPADWSTRFVAFPITSEVLKYNWKENNLNRERKKFTDKGQASPANLMRRPICPARPVPAFPAPYTTNVNVFNTTSTAPTHASSMAPALLTKADTGDEDDSEDGSEDDEEEYEEDVDDSASRNVGGHNLRKGVRSKGNYSYDAPVDPNGDEESEEDESDDVEDENDGEAADVVDEDAKYALADDGGKD